MNQEARPHNYEFGAYCLDTTERLLTCVEDGSSCRLTGRVFDTLLYLLEHPGELVEKRRLMEAVWPTVVVEDNNLEQNISTLRQALGERGRENRYIETVRGRGYRFAAPVRRVPQPSGASQDAVPSSASVTVPEAATTRLDRYARRRWLAAFAVAAVALVVAMLPWLRTTSGPPRANVSPKLAVLPFQPLTSEDRSESLELGMTETLIEGLNTADLTVASLSAARGYGGTDALTAGRALDAAAVLEGYLQRDGERLRVSARLLDVATGRQLWASRYDERFTNIFAVQDAIAAQVREALMPQLVGEVRSLRHYTQDAVAYELYVNGRLHRQRSNPEALQQALAYFEQAAQRDPGFALAYVGIADIHAILGVFGVAAPRETFPLALSAVAKALELAPDLAEAHASLGHIKMQYELDWQGAELELRRAVELNPYYGLSQQWLGLFLAESGEFDGGLEHLARAYELEHVPGYGALVGMVLNYERRFHEAIDQLGAVLETDPTLPTARAYLTFAYLRTGRLDEAAKQLERLAAPGPGSMGYLGQLYALRGQRAEALREAERLITESEHRYVSAYDIATIFAVLKDDDRALQWLERAFEERSQLIGWLPWDGVFDGIRQDPRYLELVQRLNVRKHD